ncbi:hypothetical protein B0H13DRAFT_2231061 [Mycena leptocephala]|nr:hypothetical protein B0H13DRAFT_2231061 [Mycena leptocephala]
MSSRWIPLESNPDARLLPRRFHATDVLQVLNSWSNKAGLTASEFGDVYGLDESLLAMVSQPVKAIVLLFPISPESEARRKQEDEEILSKGSPSLIQPSSGSSRRSVKLPTSAPTEILCMQISNACGTMGLIHAIANSDVTLEPDSALAKFIEQCTDKTPEERAKHDSSLRDIHAAAATSGQSAVPTNLDTDLHFTCFVAAPSSRGPSSEGSSMRIVELDGRRNGPIDRGECTNLLADAAKIIRELYIGDSQSMHFNVMSLGPPSS